MLSGGTQRRALSRYQREEMKILFIDKYAITAVYYNSRSSHMKIERSKI